MDMQSLLKTAVDKKASDLHILPGMPPLMRIDGDLISENGTPALTPEQAKSLVSSVMTPEQLALLEKKLVIEMPLSIPNVGNFRVSVFHQLRGLAGVFRVIAEKVPSFEELQLPQVLKSLLHLPHGLILVTGPTGSGKTTTLAALIDTINMLRACHIITIEDPIEYIHSNKKSAISQLQIGRDTPDVATALRSCLRQDPNVVMLGEMRDLETVNLALTAAETGHLMLATLHASTAPLAISRLIDMFPNEEKNRVRNLLSESLQAVVCQTLVKKIAGGRAAAFEILLANEAIRNMIRVDKIAQMETTLQTSGDIGMCTMEQYLNELASKRIITTVVARSVSAGRAPFKADIKRNTD